jgi:hypothetical protein
MRTESLLSVIRRQANIATSMTQSVRRSTSYAVFENFIRHSDFEELTFTGLLAGSGRGLRECPRKAP